MTDFYPPKASSQGRDLGSEDGFWTFDAVEERLIEAMRLWWRSPGEGRWPFAGDAPWHLMTRKTRVSVAVPPGLKPGEQAQIVAQMIRQDDDAETRRREGRERRGPLSRDEVAQRDETTEWLTWIADDARKVVVAALAQRAAGRKNVDWRRVKAECGAEIGRFGFYRRYTRAIAGIAKRLDAHSRAA